MAWSFCVIKHCKCAMKREVKMQNELYRLTFLRTFDQRHNRYPTSATPTIVAKDFREIGLDSGLAVDRGNSWSYVVAL